VTHAVEETDTTAGTDGNEEWVGLDDHPRLLGGLEGGLVAGGAEPGSTVAWVKLLQGELLLQVKKCGEHYVRRKGT